MCIFRVMFQTWTDRIEFNPPRLGYGVGATDIDGDGRPEFVVAGFGARNLVLDWQDDGILRDIAPTVIADVTRRAIGVAAGDVDEDGREEIYVLNTDTFMGMKRFGDRLFARTGSADRDGWFDLFELPANLENPNLSAGRSVAAIDIDGAGRYRFAVANYGAPVRLHEVDDRRRVRDIAEEVGIRLFTGGRSICILPDLTTPPAILFANENDANAFFVPDDEGAYVERAAAFGLSEDDRHARGVAVFDADGDGLLDVVIGPWDSNVRLLVRERPGETDSPFRDATPPWLSGRVRNRTVIAADFDNDGAVELFFNNFGEPNRLIRVHHGAAEELDIGDAAEPDGFGTGAAVADIDGDGVLELLVSHGEQAEQPLSLYRAPAAGEANWLRVTPLTAWGAPARNATVHMYGPAGHQVRAVDGGSGYLCQMEPTAHFGLGSSDTVEAVEVVWPDGHRRRVEHPAINREIEVNR